jgi:protein-S-isoprenylcysteine O-methyltransferase Ste14
VGRVAITSIFAILTFSTITKALHSLDRALDDHAVNLAAIAVHDWLKVSITLAFTIFVATRRPPIRRTREPLAYLACAGAMSAIVLMSSPSVHSDTIRVVLGDSTAALGAAWTLVAVLALGRCFGVLPEARGLVRRGPYRIVRHPVYLGEFGMCAGFVLAAPTLGNCLCGAVFVIAQAFRMRLEEEALTLEFPDYRQYAATTPRVIPGLAPASWRPRRTTVERVGV